MSEGYNAWRRIMYDRNQANLVAAESPIELIGHEEGAETL